MTLQFSFEQFSLVQTVEVCSVLHDNLEAMRKKPCVCVPNTFVNRLTMERAYQVLSAPIRGFLGYILQTLSQCPHRSFSTSCYLHIICNKLYSINTRPSPTPGYLQPTTALHIELEPIAIGEGSTDYRSTTNSSYVYCSGAPAMGLAEVNLSDMSEDSNTTYPQSTTTEVEPTADRPSKVT